MVNHCYYTEEAGPGIQTVVTVGFPSPPLIHIGELADIFDKRSRKQNIKYETELKGRTNFLIRRKLNIIGQSCILQKSSVKTSGNWQL